MKALSKLLLIIICSLLFIEILLRFVWGFGNPVLYIADKDFEYIYAPSQDVTRFGNKIHTNEYSMRSLPVSNNDSICILKIGDSIVNGGSLTDQDSLASTMLENELTDKFKCPVRVLNISAGSWGPDNAFAYIKKYGDFKAKLMVLVFSSHDLYDTMMHEDVVGLDLSMPKKKPFSACYELIFRYVVPRMKGYFNIPATSTSKLTPQLVGTNSNAINPGWKQFIDYSKSKKIKLLVVLHPTKYELREKKYDANGQKIISMLDSTETDYILELNQGLTQDLFRDDIHYNNKGQKQLVKELYPYLSTFVSENYKRNNSLIR